MSAAVAWPVRRGRNRRWAAVALVASAGCTTGGGADDGTCGGEVCDVAVTKADLVASLAEAQDPMAQFLRAAANDAGGIDGGWPAILEGLGDATGCDASTERSFVVLSNQALAPKAIVTRCSDQPTTASRFFMIFEPDHATGDLDESAVRVAAWDDTAGVFRRYQMVDRDGDLGVAVEPDFCASCHGGPFQMTTWTPIMNEMTNPWAQWNAEPGFVSFQFDQAFPDGAGGPVYDEVASAPRLASASDLEPIVRAAIDRTANARVAERNEAPDFDAALALLRPVFCDESVNFVSEIHDSGELATHALVDAGLRRAFIGLAGDNAWPWPWVTDPTVRIAAPLLVDDPLAMIAVRGETTVQAEAALLSRQVLSASQVLAVRALDWQHPVFSTVRCGLWQATRDRVDTGEVGLDAGAFADNAALVVALYEDAMHWPTAGGRVPLRPSAADAVVAVADAAAPGALDALDAGDFDAAAVTPDVLGEAIAAYVDSFSEQAARDLLQAERQRRACLSRNAFPITPLIPDLQDC